MANSGPSPPCPIARCPLGQRDWWRHASTPDRTGTSMRTVRERMGIRSACKEPGTLRSARAIRTTIHKTAKRVLDAAERTETCVVVKRERNLDGVRKVVAGNIDT